MLTLISDEGHASSRHAIQNVYRYIHVYCMYYQDFGILGISLFVFHPPKKKKKKNKMYVLSYSNENIHIRHSYQTRASELPPLLSHIILVLATVVIVTVIVIVTVTVTVIVIVIVKKRK